jgi:hypothetical protein
MAEIDAWLKATLEAIKDRTELTHQLVQQRLDTLSDQVQENKKTIQNHTTKLHKIDVANAKVSGRGSGRSSAWGTLDRVLTLALAGGALAIALSSC